MRSLVLLALVLLVQDVDSWIKKLSEDDVAARDEASKKLIETGEKALPKLKEALKGASGESKARLQTVIEKVEAAAAQAKLTIEFVVPEKIALKTINDDEYNGLVLRFTNSSEKDVVVYPYFNLVVKNADGKEIEAHTWIGRWGMREKDCFIECHEGMFSTVPAKKSLDVKFGIASFCQSPDAITGWGFSSAGTYTIEAKIVFNREALLAACKGGHAIHADPKQPWNRAMELDRPLTAKLKVE